MKTLIKSEVTEINRRDTGTSDHDRLHKLFTNRLNDIYWAEKALLKTLPKLIINATSEELTEIYTFHLNETEGQVVRLEKVFASIPKKVATKNRRPEQEILKDTNQVMEKSGNHEMITYRILRAFAEILGYEEAAELLQQCQYEETAGDEKVAEITSGGVLIYRK